jgi:hypothetical protein
MPDAVPPIPAETGLAAVISLGLGDHRIICGDSTDSVVVVTSSRR